MPEKITTRWLPVPLTDTELRQRGGMLASLLGDKDKVVQEAKDSASSYKSRISRLDTKIRETQTEINEKRTHRDVEVRLVPNIQDRVYEVRRSDDDTVVDLEDMTPSQFQELLNRPIPFDEEPETETAEERPWIPLSESRPEPGVWCETAQFEPNEEIYKQQPNGYVDDVHDIAYAAPPSGEGPDEEWAITHWRKSTFAAPHPHQDDFDDSDPFAEPTPDAPKGHFGLPSDTAEKLSDLSEDADNDKGAE